MDNLKEKIITLFLSVLFSLFYVSTVFADPVTIAVVSGVSAGATAFFVGGVGLTTALAYAAGTAALTYFSGKQTQKQLSGLANSSSFASSASERTRMVRQPITNRRIIYGQAKVSGPILFIESTDNNDKLHVIVAIAGHEIDSYQKFFINDVEVTLDGDPTTGLRTVTDTQYANDIKIQAYLGTSDQEANANLLNELSSVWTSNHKFLNTAYIYMRADFNSTDFSGNIPNVSAIVHGKKINDPRTGETGWSDNPALILRDYLLDTRYGLSASLDEVDDTSFISAANICDEQRVTFGYETSGETASNKNAFPTVRSDFTLSNNVITLADADSPVGASYPDFFTGDVAVFYEPTNTSLPSGITADREYFVVSHNTGTLQLADTLADARAGNTLTIAGSLTGSPKIFRFSELRYTANGVIDSGDSPKNVIEKLLGSFFADMSYTGGKFILIPPSYADPTITFTEDDLRSGMQVSPKVSRRDKFNTVKGVFVDPKQQYQPTDYEAVDSDQYIEFDDNEKIAVDVPYEFTISKSMAERLSTMLLYDSRHSMVINASMKLTALQAQIGDIVTLSSKRFGFTEETFALTTISNHINTVANSFHTRYRSRLLKLENHNFTCFDVVRVLNRDADAKSVWGIENPSETASLLDGLRVDDHYILVTNEVAYFNESDGKLYCSDTGIDSGDTPEWTDDLVVLFKIGDLGGLEEAYKTSTAETYRVQTLSDGRQRRFIRLGESLVRNAIQVGDLGTSGYVNGNEVIKREAKMFRIIEMKINSDKAGDAVYLGADLTLKEVSFAQYDQFESRIDFSTFTNNTMGTDDDTIGTTSFRTPINAIFAPTGLTLTTGDDVLLGENFSSTTGAGIKIAWTAPEDFEIHQYEVQWKLSTDGDGLYRKIFVSGLTTSFIQRPLTTGDTINVRVRAISALGIISQFVSGNVVVVGTNAVPVIPTDGDFNVTLEAVEEGSSVMGIWVEPTFDLPSDVKGRDHAIIYSVNNDHTTNSNAPSSVYQSWANSTDKRYSVKHSNGKYLLLNHEAYSDEALSAKLDDNPTQRRLAKGLDFKNIIYRSATGFSIGTYYVYIGLYDGVRTSSNFVSKRITFPNYSWNNVSLRQELIPSTIEAIDTIGGNSLYNGTLSVSFGTIDYNSAIEEAYNDDTTGGTWDDLSTQTWDATTTEFNNLSIQSSLDTEAQYTGTYGSSRVTPLLNHKAFDAKINSSVSGTNVSFDGSTPYFYWSPTGSTTQFGGSTDFVANNTFTSTNSFSRDQTVRSFRVFWELTNTDTSTNYVFNKITNDLIENYITETKTLNMGSASVTSTNSDGHFSANPAFISTGLAQFAIDFDSSTMSSSQRMIYHRVNVTVPDGFYFRLISYSGDMPNYFTGTSGFNLNVEAVRVEIRSESDDSLSNQNISVEMIASKRVL